MKIALIVGHTKNGDKGAYSNFLKTSEYDYWFAVAKIIERIGNNNVDIYDMYTHSIQGYYNRQKALATELNKKKYDLAVELHFNAASPLANGTECLHWFASVKGKLASQSISKHISEVFETTLRGDKGAKALVNKNDRGYWFTYLPKAPAIILEPFFGSNPEALRFQDKEKVACALHTSFMNLKGVI